MEKAVLPKLPQFGVQFPKELNGLFRRWTPGSDYIQEQPQLFGQGFITFFHLQHTDISLFRETELFPGIIEKVNARFIAKKEVILAFCQNHDRNFTININLQN
jgi:hypothetical protein